MRRASVEWERHGFDRVRVHAGRADGYPQPELAFVGFMGSGREVVVVGREPRVDGADVLYQLDPTAAASVFKAACDRGVVVADCGTGLAMVARGGSGA